VYSVTPEAHDGPPCLNGKVLSGDACATDIILGAFADGKPHRVQLGLTHILARDSSSSSSSSGSAVAVAPATVYVSGFVNHTQTAHEAV
jgi:hypothetical protein